jgi:hypothetical protein
MNQLCESNAEFVNVQHCRLLSRVVLSCNHHFSVDKYVQLGGDDVECRLATHNQIPSPYRSVVCKCDFLSGPCVTDLVRLFLE